MPPHGRPPHGGATVGRSLNGSYALNISINMHLNIYIGLHTYIIYIFIYVLYALRQHGLCCAAVRPAPGPSNIGKCIKATWAGLPHGGAYYRLQPQWLMRLKYIYVSKMIYMYMYTYTYFIYLYIYIFIYTCDMH